MPNLWGFFPIFDSIEYDCHKPLGMEDRRIPDSSLSASSQYNKYSYIKPSLKREIPK